MGRRRTGLISFVDSSPLNVPKSYSDRRKAFKGALWTLTRTTNHALKDGVVRFESLPALLRVDPSGQGPKLAKGRRVHSGSDIVASPVAQRVSPAYSVMNETVTCRVTAAARARSESRRAMIQFCEAD